MGNDASRVWRDRRRRAPPSKDCRASIAGDLEPRIIRVICTEPSVERLAAFFTLTARRLLPCSLPDPRGSTLKASTLPNEKPRQLHANQRRLEFSAVLNLSNLAALTLTEYEQNILAELANAAVHLLQGLESF